MRLDEHGFSRDSRPRRGAGVPGALPPVAAVLDALPAGPHEMVFVDDGSTERTFDLIIEAAATDSRVVGVRLSRNFGHQAASTAALEAGTGDVLVAMDGLRS